MRAPLRRPCERPSHPSRALESSALHSFLDEYSRLTASRPVADNGRFLYEWYSTYIRVTLEDTTPSNFALASTNDGNLFLAFRGEQNHLDVMFSNDHGNCFGNKLTSGELTSQGPALAFHEGILFVAWTGVGNNRLNVAVVTLGGDKVGLADKVTLPLGWDSSRSPALASFGGALHLAWKDDSDRLNVASSTDGGQTFRQPFTSNETSPQAPTLAVHDGRLLIGWKGDGNDLLNVATVTISGGVATAISGKVIIPTETSPLSPSLASLGEVLFLSWKGDGNDYLNVMQSTDGGRSFFDKFTSFETSPSAPTLAVHEDELFIGWRGEQDLWISGWSASAMERSSASARIHPICI